MSDQHDATPPTAANPYAPPVARVGDVAAAPPAIAPPLASLPRRWAALTFDSILVMFAGGLLAVPVLAWLEPALMDDASAEMPGAVEATVGVALLLFGAAYEALILRWRGRGQTLGKAVFRLKVIDAAGGAIGGAQAWRRSLLRWVLGAIWFLSALDHTWGIFTAERTTWHDLFAGTRVVRWDEEEGRLSPGVAVGIALLALLALTVAAFAGTFAIMAMRGEL